TSIVNGNPFQNLEAGGVLSAVYDATLNVWLCSSGGISSGVCPQYCAMLCAYVGAHPHFNIPAMACTPMTDYTTQLATWCQANMPSWMIPRFEIVNEVWNYANGFQQTRYAWAVANAYGW